MSHRIRRTLVALGLFVCMALGACATEDEPEAEESPSPTEEAAAEIEVTGTDYAFDGIPTTIDANSKIVFTNASTEEVHEIVAFNLPESETRSAADLFKLPQAELIPALGGEPVAVLVQPPGGEVIEAVGDGTLTEPGRYVFGCFIGTGVDPAVYMAALQEAQGEQVIIPGAGPPHFVNGMFAEATVE